MTEDRQLNVRVPTRVHDAATQLCEELARDYPRATKADLVGALICAANVAKARAALKAYYAADRTAQ